jgi:acyl carrier protein
MRTIDEKVTEIIVKELGAEESEVVSYASLVDDLQANSFDMIELILAFEQEFGIEIPDADAERIRSVADAIYCVRSQGGTVGSHGILQEQS